MAKDKTIDYLLSKKMAEMQAMVKDANTEPREPDQCTNCKGQCELDLLTALNADAVFCPSCVIKAAVAFVNSESFMIELAHTPKTTFAKVQRFDTKLNKLVDPMIIDTARQPIISVVGTVNFYKDMVISRKKKEIKIKRG